MDPTKILTFNHHEPYICSLAEIGGQFDVIVNYRGLDLSWNKSTHPVPENVNLVEFDEVIKKRLNEDYYDVIVCHTVKNLLWLFLYTKCSFVFVAHIPLFKYRMNLLIKSFFKKVFWQVFKLTHRASFVAVSEFKRKSWNEKGDVVILSPNYLGSLEEGSGYNAAAVVCNDLASRKEELGLPLIESLREQFSIEIIGKNPGIDGATQPKDFESFKKVFCSHRIYLYTIKYPYGDGYNTAMLEAMKMGMAILTVENPSSPIVHGENGLVFTNLAEASACLKSLLDDPVLVDTLGKRAKDYVDKNFSREVYIRGWQSILKNASLS